LTKVATAAATTVGLSVAIAVGANNPVQAITLVTFSIEPSGANPTAVGLCQGIFDCSKLPGTLTANLSVPARTVTSYRLNDTGLNRTSVLYTIADPANFAFSPTGSTSSIFSKIQVLNNGTQLLFTGGANRPGEYYSVTRSFEPQSTATFAFTAAETFTSAEAIPEPAAVLSLVAFAALGATLKGKKS
jgi:hypothetical protein